MVTPSSIASSSSSAMSRHALLVAAIDDDGVGGSETARCARRVECGIAAAVDCDASAQ